MQEEIYLVLISASAIGAMMAIEKLFLGDIIQKSPLIALIGFLVLMGFSHKISEKVGFT